MFRMVVALASVTMLPLLECYLNTPVPSLLQIHRSTIEQLKISPATKPLDSEIGVDDMFYLRHVLEYDVGNEEDDEGGLALMTAVGTTLRWRRNEGKFIVEAAAKAVDEATSGGGGSWNNDPVARAAPHASRILPFVDNSILTTSARSSDLIYCIRAGSIDDAGLMKKVSEEELTDFFLYAKEVNAIVADRRSLQSGRFCTVMTANDLSK